MLSVLGSKQKCLGNPKGHAKLYQRITNVRHEGTKRSKGRCKLGWLKSNKSPSPKSSYFNAKMEK
jgi:hypothetical protein